MPFFVEAKNKKSVCVLSIKSLSFLCSINTKNPKLIPSSSRVGTEGYKQLNPFALIKKVISILKRRFNFLVMIECILFILRRHVICVEPVSCVYPLPCLASVPSPSPF